MASLNELWGNLAPSPRRDIKRDTLTEAKNQDRPAAMPAPRADNTSSLTIEARDKLAALRKQFRDKIKSQLDSGLDPELVAIVAKTGAVYAKARARRFRDLIRAMMEDLGITGASGEFWCGD